MIKGYKVTNKNAIVSENKTTDTVFFFQDLISATEYYNTICGFDTSCDIKQCLEKEHILEPMSPEEEEKFNFKIPLNYQIPHKMITKPIFINEKEPYWVEIRELLMPKNCNT